MESPAANGALSNAKLKVKLKGDTALDASTHFHPLPADVLLAGNTSALVSFLYHNLGLRPAVTLMLLGSTMVAVIALLSMQIELMGNGAEVMVGPVKSALIPVNSSAPISGVDVFLVFPSISSVMPVTGIPPLSIWVGIPVMICRFNGALKKLGDSDKEALSLGLTLAL